MTTASLIVIDSKAKKSKTYWVWHDGYKVDKLLKNAQERNKKNYGMDLKKFTIATLESQILSDKKNNFAMGFNNKAGDWHWTLVILDTNHAILTGAGNDDIRTAYWEI